MSGNGRATPQSGLNPSVMLRMPMIEERESELDNMEELEGKEKEYTRRIQQKEE